MSVIYDTKPILIMTQWDIIYSLKWSEQQLHEDYSVICRIIDNALGCILKRGKPTLIDFWSVPMLNVLSKRSDLQ